MHGKAYAHWWILLLLGACAPPQPKLTEFPPALQQIRFAPLEPGRGLGDLRLGETTLEQCTERFKPFDIRILDGHESTLELACANGQLRLRFALGETYEVTLLPSALADSPGLATLPLASIEIHPPSGGEHYYLGRYSRQLDLASTADDVLHLLGNPAAEPDTQHHEFVLGYPGIAFQCRRGGTESRARVQSIVLWQPLPAAPR